MAKILIVDDDAAVQATVRLLLERAGHTVVTAGDGRKGLAQLEADEFCREWTGSRPCEWCTNIGRWFRSS